MQYKVRVADTQSVNELKLFSGRKGWREKNTKQIYKVAQLATKWIVPLEN